MSSSSKRGNVYHSQARATIVAVMQYFETKRENKGSLIDVKKVCERVSTASEVLLRTITRIKREVEDGTNKRKVLMEKASVALSRCRFLRKIRNVDFNSVVCWMKLG